MAKDQINIIELVGRRLRTPREIAQARDHFLTGPDTRIESFGFTQVIANRPQRIRKRVQFVLLGRGHLAQRIEQPAHRWLHDHPPVTEKGALMMGQCSLFSSANRSFREGWRSPWSMAPMSIGAAFTTSGQCLCRPFRLLGDRGERNPARAGASQHGGE